MRDNLRASLISGALSAVIMSLFFSLWAGLRIGIIAGAAAGLAFGLAVGVFLAIQERKAKAARSEITQGKSVIMDGGANHLKGAEGVGGWLYLTPDEVIFKSHKFNIQVHQTTMPLDDIEEVRAVRTVGLIPNGLLIRTKDGSAQRFVVHNRSTWVQKIDDARGAHRSQPQD